MIESRYHLEAGQLAERDFEFLRKVIFEKTQTDLSTATLRRIWTRQHQGSPQAKTLDALARFLDFESWHHFRASPEVTSEIQSRVRHSRLIIVVIPLLLLGVAAFMIDKGPRYSSATLEPEVSEYEGVPATIGFHYTIEDPGIEIELSWNPYERTRLEETRTFYSGTYYYPDYHEAKLIAGDLTLATKHVHITTAGWHGLIMRSGYDTNPIYLGSEDFMAENQLGVKDDISQQYELDCSNQCYLVFTLSNKSLSEISGDNFSLTTSFNNIGESPGNICAHTDVIIRGEQGTVRAPISRTGCYGITTLKVGELTLPGKLNDLSALSTDLQTNQTIMISNEDKILTIRVGNNEPFSLPHQESIGPLKVVKIIFSGAGVLTDFQINNNDGEAFELGLAPFDQED